MAVRPGVAVAEPGDLAGLARDEEDEVVSPRVLRQTLTRPVVGEGAGTESRAVNLAQLGVQREWIDLFDYGFDWSASRSTTTWVSGTSKRVRAFSTTPRSSQCDRPGGWVEMMSSSGRNVRTASSIA
jgi:hypothetical protein